MKQHTPHKMLRLLSVFEAAKGLLVVLAGARLLALIHKNVHGAATEIVKILHLNPAHHYPEIFINTFANLSNVNLWLLSISAVLYSLIRFAEAYGLWNNRQWAIWFGVASGALFLPMELYEVIEKITIVRIVILLMNVLLIFYLFRWVCKELPKSKREKVQSGF
jgi:uncharacterized membrane protein (DUF2068 family)